MTRPREAAARWGWELGGGGGQRVFPVYPTRFLTDISFQAESLFLSFDFLHLGQTPFPIFFLSPESEPGNCWIPGRACCSIWVELSAFCHFSSLMTSTG